MCLLSDLSEFLESRRAGFLWLSSKVHTEVPKAGGDNGTLNRAHCLLWFIAGVMCRGEYQHDVLAFAESAVEP